MGLLDMNEEQNSGLLNFGLNMLANSGPSSTQRGFGEIVGMSGKQTMAQMAEARKLKDTEEYRKMQMANMRAQEEQRLQLATAGRSKQDSIGRIVKGYDGNPDFKPSMGDLFAVDPSAAFKTIYPKAGDNAHGLEPKVGKNPATGELSYFVQDRQGGTRWLDAQVPDNFKLIPGSDYKQPQAFNPRSGTVAPVGAPNPFSAGPSGGAPSMPQPSGGPVGMPLPEPEPTFDPRAPWNNIVSPKERDQMKPRVYEQDSKRLDDLRKRVAEGTITMTDLDRFGTLNRNTGTGGVFDRMPGPTFDTDKREMEAISARLAPSVREPGSGSSSDRDVSLFLQGLPGIEKEGNVNANIRAQYAKQLADAKENLTFREQYLAERGHLSGVNEAFADRNKPRTNGLDESKLTPQQRSYLQTQDPTAYANGIERFTTGKVGQAGAQKLPKSANLLSALPTANQSNRGKVAVDHESGKKFKSTGMQWVEVQ